MSLNLALDRGFSIQNVANLRGIIIRWNNCREWERVWLGPQTNAKNAMQSGLVTRPGNRGTRGASDREGKLKP